MRASNLLTSACRCCQHYTPEGRRGGLCHQLHVPVQGSWKACPLALPAFAPSWETVDTVIHFNQTLPTLREAMVGDLPNITATHPELEISMDEPREREAIAV
ncbi:MAG: hypothetical protein KFF72_03275 [Arthrospira sp. SH-MAG29]|nr:hypothetical protein [Arthrospira sp. SH-MAG29]MBS0015384.1 hypothetical protein [Arthrospira sp. SH-MAG29]